MSKTSKRKSSESGKQSENRTASATSNIKDCSSSSVVKRQSVFERLGTKATFTERNLSVNTSISDAFCRSWAQNGTCAYDKSCKLAHSHSLISPSKRSSSSKKDSDLVLTTSIVSRRQIEEEKGRVVSSIKHQSPDVSTWENWDQTELEYEDEKVLEKRRAALQRELELQMKKDGNRKEVVKARRSSSTSSLSSTSSVSSSSSSSSRSSVSVIKKVDDKKRRPSSSSPEPEKKKLGMKSSSHKDSPPKKMSSSGVRDADRSKGRVSGGVSPLRQLQSRKRSLSPPRKPSPKTKVSSSAIDPYKGITLEVTLKNDLALRASSSRRKDSPLRRAISSDRRSRRSSSRTRRRSPLARASVARRSRAHSPPRPPTSSRARSPERKKDDDRKKDDRRDRKTDYREKKDTHDDARNRVKARDMREVTREKERLEALERCRERQREREQKEKERLREERERKDSKRSGRAISRSSTVSSDKRHERGYDRFDRGKAERDRSFERERVRDRALERMMERKSVERNRERSRDRYGDRGNYSDSRRILQVEEKNYSPSPFRGTDRTRYEAERERLSPRDERLSRSGYTDDRRDRGRSRGWPNEGQSSSQSARYEEPSREREKPSRSSGGGEWTGDRGNDFQESAPSRSREWDASRIRDEGGDDWAGYDRSAPSDWHSNRQHTHHHHIDDRRERHHGSESKEPPPPVDPVKEKDPGFSAVDNLGKRAGPVEENEDPVKRARLSEPALEELSDISDGPDDILNRDDIEFTEGEDSRMGDSSQAVLGDTSSGQGADGHIDDTLQAPSPNIRPGEDENIGLDFEEISDEELEEESKINKGGSVGDALGVDWASLMAECRPQKKKTEENGESTVSSVRARWEPAGMLGRLGISTTLASADYVKKLKENYPQLFPGDDATGKDQNQRSVLGVAALQRKMAERKAKRENLIAISMENKQALSARADIAIRRRLCGLPVISLETHNTTGFCPWAV